MTKRMLSMMLATIVALAMIAVPADGHAGSRTEKMTTYNKIVKRGNTVCVSLKDAIVAVNLKNGKTRILENKTPTELLPGCGIKHMKIKGNYLYYIDVLGTDHWDTFFYRVNIKNGKKKRLGRDVLGYVIKGKKLYYLGHKIDWSNGGKDIKKNRVMKLNGKGKKKTSVKAKMKSKSSNARGYSVVHSYSYTKNGYDAQYDVTDVISYHKYYLKKPNGKKVFLMTRGVVVDTY